MFPLTLLPSFLLTTHIHKLNSFGRYVGDLRAFILGSVNDGDELTMACMHDMHDTRHV